MQPLPKTMTKDPLLTTDANADTGIIKGGMSVKHWTGGSYVAKDDFIIKMQAQTLRNEITDRVININAILEELRVKRNVVGHLKRQLHELENPGKPFIDTDLF
jgi:hypothetical protein